VTPAPVGVRLAPLYEALGARYVRELAGQGVGAVMVAHKWEGVDLLAPHSDLDLRIVVDRPPGSWWDWNERLAAAHRAVVAADPFNRRLLEHPPGFAFVRGEIGEGRVAAAELATWSHLHGHALMLHRWKSQSRAVPWSGVDERFYRGILNARLGGVYRLEADSTDNVSVDLSGYQRHCVAWHYLAPCWFAVAALATRTRFPGKTAALTQWRPNAVERIAQLFLAPGDTAARPRELLRLADDALHAVITHIPPAPASSAAPCVSRAVNWTTTIGMLRVRVARWLYYLDPPQGVQTGYLISREAKELRAARRTLLALAESASSGGERRLATRMAVLLPYGPVSAPVLRAVLAAWQQRERLVEEFLST
jgi:hypothetical protein